METLVHDAAGSIRVDDPFLEYGRRFKLTEKAAVARHYIPHYEYHITHKVIEINKLLNASNSNICYVSLKLDEYSKILAFPKKELILLND